MNYTTDTHSLVWYFTDDARLNKKALDSFEQAIKKGLIILPAVVLAEIMFISRKGKINLTFKQTLEVLEEYENFDIAPLDINILKVADKIEAALEMHDRLIVATALYFNAPLITKDKMIRDAEIVTTIW